ncbi:hypothetical protein CP965_10880 [Halarcobacter mediterraneus]|uniref:Glycosyltransferase 2-like domain-containing protein n=1 Tax=Halarcobacter mediterraneus TaxID=2023153 RepID=A0A4Q1ARQ8_9BACT|nr:glycosyltransferase family 2 protein [Halarcobacter mediterraneus]RXK12264.1 hypothetical protein CP965_10880 [Halarcobacter mediterraneus]
MISKKVSFITINYNSSTYTIKLLESIYKNTIDIVYEIVVVDNNSEKKDLEKLENYIFNKKNIKLIKNSINSGFASGNMLGVNYAEGEYYFFINNDCVLLNNSAKILKDFLEKNEEVSLVTGKVLDANGKYSSSYKQFPHILKQIFGNSVERFFSKNKYPSNKINLENNSQVEVVSGSCMFFDAKTFCEIGGFDTIFFLYCEEEDISKRVWDFGKKVYFIPKAEIFHKAGGSSIQSFEMEQEFYISYYHLLDKHYNLIGKFILKATLFFKLFFRIFKKKNGLKILFSFFKGFSKKDSIRYIQKIKV